MGFVGLPRIRSLAFRVVRQEKIASKIFSLMAAASSAMMRMFGEWKPWKRSVALVAKPSA